MLIVLLNGKRKKIVPNQYKVKYYYSKASDTCKAFKHICICNIHLVLQLILARYRLHK